MGGRREAVSESVPVVPPDIKKFSPTWRVRGRPTRGGEQ